MDFPTRREMILASTEKQCTLGNSLRIEHAAVNGIVSDGAALYIVFTGNKENAYKTDISYLVMSYDGETAIAAENTIRWKFMNVQTGNCIAVCVNLNTPCARGVGNVTLADEFNIRQLYAGRVHYNCSSAGEKAVDYVSIGIQAVRQVNPCNGVRGVMG